MKLFGTNLVTEALDKISKAQNSLSRFADCKLQSVKRNVKQKNKFFVVGKLAFKLQKQ